MADVELVTMPYASAERPSLALGILRSSLRETSLTTNVVYANLQFAEEIGLEKFSEIVLGTYHLLGEWTFTPSAFPDFNPNSDFYLWYCETLRNLSDPTNQRRESTLQDAYARLNGEHPVQNPEVYSELKEQASRFVTRLATEIVERRPRIVGCTSMFQQHVASLALLRKIKELDANIITMMGGPHCEGPMARATTKEFPWVDFAMSGEADLVFPAVCETLCKSGLDVDIHDLPEALIGAPHRYSDEEYARIVAAPPRVVVTEMDKIPVPDFDDYFTELERLGIAPLIETALPIETSRGCWWGMKRQCTFCGLNGGGMEFRPKSSGRVVDEFEYLSERYSINRFQTADNILHTEYFDSVLPALARSRTRYNIFFECKANLKREQVKRLSNAGIRWIQPGIESMHNEVLELLSKGTKDYINTQLLKWAREFGVRVYWLFLYGLPDEQDEWYLEMAERLPLLFHLEPPTRLITVNYDRFSPYQTRPEEYGIKNLRPLRFYQYVYPLDSAGMADVAYYFDDLGEGERWKLQLLTRIPGAGDVVRRFLEASPAGDAPLLDRPGLAKLNEVVTRWQEIWDLAGERIGRMAETQLVGAGGERPLLNMQDRDGSVQIFDTRPVAYERETRLTGLAAAIYRACDSARSEEGLLRALRNEASISVSWGEIEPIVDELLERRIACRLSGHLLSLAVREPSRPYPTVYPGGDIKIGNRAAAESRSKSTAWKSN